MSTMKKIVAIAMLLTLCILPGCSKEKGSEGKQAQKAAAAVTEGSMAPDFSVKDLSGKEVKLSSLKGNVVMVNFWATWCPPCKEEIPSLMKLEKAMAGKPFRMLAISIDEEGKPAVEKYFQSSGNLLPAYLDSDGSVSRNYGITGVPETFILDKSGNIQKKIVGGMDWSAKDVISYLDELAKK